MDISDGLVMEKKRYLDPEVKKKWVEDLRSGKFTQGSGSLRSPLGRTPQGQRVNSYCCLGVLAESMGLLDERDAFKGHGSGLPSCGKLEGVDQSPEWGSGCWLSSTATGYAVLPKEIQLKLADLNDRHIPFKDIADVIEQDEEI